MKVKQFHWSEYNSTNSAIIEVPGLGDVDVKNFMSDEVRDRIHAEAVLALQQRLGIVCNFRDNE